MGTVFLAEQPGGRRVAVKVIRTDRSDDAEFRRRFRGEVKRARQVPPFCTAEVLDADPDHEPPYLVVEYVDGPSLAAVVAERGPLTAGNLHGLAISVATALTAIHGAGVIHRDLKPSNVLLPPGSPKVIDFGIARAVEGSAVTRTDQVVGTVAYMAPERFEPAGSGTLTAAADVFAWGAVVAFAGTGRTPFAADTPQATAVRILTQEPGLDGLTGPLRTLVEQALAKDPASRPGARELLDRLLTVAPRPETGSAEVTADRSALLAAVEQAQAATDQRPLLETELAGRRHTTHGSVVASGAPATPPADDDATTRWGVSSATPTPRPTSVARPADALPASAPPPATSAPAMSPPAPTPRRWPFVAATVLSALALVAALAGVGVLTGVLRGGPGEPLGLAPTPSVEPSVEPSGATPALPSVVIRDPLTVTNYWRTRTDEKNRVSCAFDGAYVVTKRSEGPYRCLGPQQSFADFQVEVDVALRRPGSCAGIWFRFTDLTGGHALRVCPDGYHLVAHGVDSPNAVTPAGTFPYPAGQLALGRTIQVGIVARGGQLRFLREGVEIGAARDGAPVPGRVVLGIFRDPARDEPAEPPYEVAFRDVEIRQLD